MLFVPYFTSDLLVSLANATRNATVTSTSTTRCADQTDFCTSPLALPDASTLPAHPRAIIWSVVKSSKRIPHCVSSV